MNLTPLEHVVVALVIQAVPGIWFNDWLTGGLVAIGIFLGREHAQREYKIGDPSKLIGYEALDFWNWSKDAKLDLVCPTLAVTFMYLYSQFYLSL